MTDTETPRAAEVAAVVERLQGTVAVILDAYSPISGTQRLLHYDAWQALDAAISALTTAEAEITRLRAALSAAETRESGNHMAAVFKGEQLTKANEVITRLQGEVEREREARDVWKSKSGMHQRQATGLCVLEAHITRLADKWDAYSKSPDEGDGYGAYAEGHAACAIELRSVVASIRARSTTTTEGADRG